MVSKGLYSNGFVLIVRVPSLSVFTHKGHMILDAK
jgi:hypothetical protein